MSVDTRLAGLEGMCESATVHAEGGVTLVHLRGLRLPTGCSPAVIDAVLWAGMHGSYSTRLFFAEQIVGGVTANWTPHTILAKSWVAPSFQLGAEGLGLSWLQMVACHLKAFR